MIIKLMILGTVSNLLLVLHICSSTPCPASMIQSINLPIIPQKSLLPSQQRVLLLLFIPRPEDLILNPMPILSTPHLPLPIHKFGSQFWSKKECKRISRLAKPVRTHVGNDAVQATLQLPLSQEAERVADVDYDAAWELGGGDPGLGTLAVDL